MTFRLFAFGEKRRKTDIIEKIFNIRLRTSS